MTPAGSTCPSSSRSLLALLLVTACSGIQEATIVRMDGAGEPEPIEVISAEGRRDGDRLPVRILIRSAEDTIVLDLHFRIGVPTRLESGRYRWEREGGVGEGTVRALSVTFLGGQSDDPSVGGVLELVSEPEAPGYKITLPTRPVTRPKSKAFPLLPSH